MIAMRDATCGVGCVGGGGESRWKSRRCEHESWRRRTEQRQSWRDWCSIPEPLPCAAPQVLCSSGLMMVSAAELLYTAATCGSSAGLPTFPLRGVDAVL